MKPLLWVGSSKKDLLAMPGEVQDIFGFALHQAQDGGKHPQAKPLKGFSGAGVLKVVEDYDGDTYRAINRQIQGRHLRVAFLPEEVNQRCRNAEARSRPDQIQTAKRA